MTFTVEQLQNIYENQLFINFSESQRETIWKQTQKLPHSCAGGRWRSFLNSLCLSLISDWLKADLECSEDELQVSSPNQLQTIWDVVNGTALQVKNTRLILIPSDEINSHEFSVPREWVDIPSWAGHYYLAVQLDLEAGWLRVWGAATHAQLLAGAYDEQERNFSVETEDLIEDLSLIWMMQELRPEPHPQVQPLLNLGSATAERLLEELGKPSAYSPRLKIPFTQWAALIANESWCRQLSQRRRGCWMPPLRQWFERERVGQLLGGAGWQPYQTAVRSTKLGFRRYPATVKWVKTINLVPGWNSEITLIIELTQERDADTNLWVRLRLLPLRELERYLPTGLTLTVLESSGEIIAVRQSEPETELMNFPRFQGTPGTDFTVEIGYGEIVITEEFSI